MESAQPPPDEPGQADPGQPEQPDEQLAQDYVPVEPSSEVSPEVYSLSNAPADWDDPVAVKRIKSRTPRKAAAKSSQDRSLVVLACSLMVFLTSACVMVLELSAARLVQRHLGSSLYTWTSVIGVVLAGITIGNYLGGWLSDRFDRARLLPLLFLLASVLCYSVLWVDRIVAEQPHPAEWKWSRWVLLLVTECYLLPSIALGTISPVLASLALSHSRKQGMTVGRVYAWGAFGSIVGTFLTGFVLIETFGTRSIIGGTALVLAALGVLSASGRPALRSFLFFGWSQWIVVSLLLMTSTPVAIAGFGHRLACLLEGRWATAEAEQPELAEPLSALEILQANYEFAFDREAYDLSVELLARNADPVRAGDLVWEVAAELDLPDRIALLNTFVNESQVQSTTLDWLNRGWTVGAYLQRIGYVLWLRSDYPGEYHDESRYSYINVSPADSLDTDAVQLRLDKLIHAYYSPHEPDRLFYEYEQVYAAVTELSLEQRPIVGRIDLKALDAERIEELKQTAAWPPNVELEDGSSQLVIRGGLGQHRLRQLRKIARAGDYWNALLALQKMTQADDWGGYSTVDLAELPGNVELTPELAQAVSYDRLLGKLIAYQAIDSGLFKRLVDASSESGLYWQLDAQARQTRQARTLFLGGGGFVFPRWVETHLGPTTTIEVVEIDPAVVTAVRKRMGLLHPTRTRIRTHIADARVFVEQLLATAGGEFEPYDFIYGDAFQDFNIPFHLTTLEFTRKVHSLLAADGIYLVNLIDIYPRHEFRSRQAVETSVAHNGPIPAEWKQQALPKRWVRLKNAGGLQLRYVQEGQCELRFAGRMSTSLYDELKTQAADNLPLLADLEQLYVQSRQPAAFAGDLPVEWWQAAPTHGGWWAVPEAAGIELQVLEAAEGQQPPLAIAFHGCATTELRDQLVAQYGSYGKLREAIEWWYEQPVPAPGRFLGRFVLTTSEVFPCVYLFSGTEGAPTGQRDTFVAIASRKPIDFTAIDQTQLWSQQPFAAIETDPESGEVRLSGQMAAVLGLAEGLKLTDNFAPVENLIAPLFEQQNPD